MLALRSSVATLTLLVAVAACAPDRLTSVAPALSIPSASAAPSTASAVLAPTFLRPAANAPAIANPVVRFWAKRGADTTAEMYYHRVAGRRDSTVFFSLRLKAKTLARRPDGTAFGDRDSVLITLTLVDARKGIVDCQPSGLRFAADAPARLKINFTEADADLNDDGRVNTVDAALTRAITVWRRESPAEPWTRVASRVEVGAHEVEAEIGGFTGYAIAW
jgi:hypothetical protein